MFPRRMRLSRQDFSLVSSDPKAKRATSTHFSVLASRLAHGVSIVVSKKVAVTSVDRHLLKRRIRAAVRPWHLSLLPESTPCALIVYARPGSTHLPFSELSSELEALLRRVA